MAPSTFLMKAIGLLSPEQTTALDLGCGAGRDTRYLSKQGFAVTAIDIDPEVEQYLKDLPPDTVQFVHADLGSFNFDSYDLINSCVSLPFLESNTFNSVLQKITSSLKSGGVFVGTFMGPHDDWNRPGTLMTFIDKQSLKKFFTDLNIFTLGEYEEDGATATGTPKHWHFVSCIVQKPRT